VSEHGAVFRADDLALTLSCTAPLERRGADVRGELTGNAGETAIALLGVAGRRRTPARGSAEMEAVADQTSGTGVPG